MLFPDTDSFTHIKSIDPPIRMYVNSVSQQRAGTLQECSILIMGKKQQQFKEKAI